MTPPNRLSPGPSGPGLREQTGEAYPGEAETRDMVHRLFLNQVQAAKEWLFVADELRLAAAVLEPKVRKWIADARARLARKKVGFPSRLLRHDLKELAAAAGFKVKGAHHGCLERLTHAVTWGRYPVQRKAVEQEPLGSAGRLLRAFAREKEIDETKAFVSDVLAWAKEK